MAQDAACRTAHFAACGVLPIYRVARLDHFGAAVRTAYDAMRTNRSGLFAKGSVGTGKTYLAAAICAATIYEAPRGAEPGERLPRVELVMARQLLRRLWETFRDGATDTESQVIEYFTCLDLLVIDDLAHEGRVSDAGVGALHEILSVRLGCHRPTVVTSNLTLAQIAGTYDAAIASRLGAFEQVTMAGEDRR